jgi:hypothetical protein
VVPAAPTEVAAESGFGDFAGPDAAGANTHPLGGFAVNDPNLLKIWIPAAPGEVVGVAYPIAVNWTFVTNVTSLSHVEISSKYKERV